MTRLYLFAEGATEQIFASNTLAPHLAGFGVYLHPPLLIAHAKRKGRVHRGGGRNYAPMRNDILTLLAQDKARNAFFTTMIDLYAIHTEFPGLVETQNLRHIPEKRVEALEQSFAGDIRDPRFIPYIQLHEYEAYLFSDPEKFRFFYRRHEKAIAALRAIANGVSSPELINDSPDGAPSKRIIAVFPDYKDAKSVVGPQIAELIGLQVIRDKCPHFNAWLTSLERLQQVNHVSD